MDDVVDQLFPPAYHHHLHHHHHHQSQFHQSHIYYSNLPSRNPSPGPSTTTTTTTTSPNPRSPDNLFVPPTNNDHDRQHTHDPPIDEEPLYVNAKQYFRILKRRVARARLEEVHRLSRQRKPYLHESRHKHAMRRPRGPGGRFLTAEEIAAQKAANGEAPGPSNHSNEDAEEDVDQDVNMDVKPQQLPSQAPQQQRPPPPPPPMIAPQPPSQPAIAMHPTIHQHDQDTFVHPQSTDISMMNMTFRPLNPPAIAPAHMTSQPSAPQQQQQQPATQTHHAPHRHQSQVTLNPNPPRSTYPPQFNQSQKGTTNPAPITLSAPYAVQMHHVPHPHAHARHHHSHLNYTQGLYADAAGVVNEASLQRRPDETIQFSNTQGGAAE